MKVRLAGASDRAAWDRFVLAHPEGSAYHLFGWKSAVEGAYGLSCPYLLAEGGGDVRGVFPLVHLRAPLGRGVLVSLPYCDVGGPLSDAADGVQALLGAARALAGERRVGLELRSALPAGGLVSSPHKVRMVLALPDNSEALLGGLSSKLRSQARKPEKDGLTARLGGAEFIGDFYRVFAENMRDLGSPVHSRAWIEAVVRGYGERARVGVVYLPTGEPAAGGLILCHDRTVSIPWASSLRRYNRQNPNMLLYWGFLRFAADRGYPRFDFGRSTPGEGTYKFKEQWGARPEPLHWRVLSAAGERPAAEGPPSSLRERVAWAWAKLPLPVANWLGPRLRKHISL